MADSSSSHSDAQSCPTCGQAVEVVSSDEGTSHYVGIDAWDANTLRVERDAAIASATMGLAQTLRLIRDTCPSSDASRMAAGALRRAGIEDPERECQLPPAGWTCSRGHQHDGPCAARPDVAEHIRVELARNMMSQQGLAEILGYTQAAVSYWATGKRQPSLTDLCRLADVFGVTTDYLLGRAAW